VIKKARQAKDARRVRGSGIRSEFVGHPAEQSFRTIAAYAVNLPYDLEFIAGRRENIVRLRHEVRSLYRIKGGGSLVVEINIQITYREDVLFGSRSSTRLERIHADINIEPVSAVLGVKPFLERPFEDSCGASDALDRLSSVSVPHQESQLIRGLKNLSKVIRCLDLLPFAGSLDHG
jgi:hypothetical protein